MVRINFLIIISPVIFNKIGSSTLTQPPILKLDVYEQFKFLTEDLLRFLDAEGVKVLEMKDIFPEYLEEGEESDEVITDEPSEEDEVFRSTTANVTASRGVMSRKQTISGFALQEAAIIESTALSFMHKAAHKIRSALHLNVKDEVFFNETLSELETRTKRDDNSLFYWVSIGDLPSLQNCIAKILKRDPNGFQVREIDPTGATIIHKAYLLKYYEIGHWLVNKFPELALVGYSNQVPVELSEVYGPEDMPYTGATVLHLVILRRDFEEVRWLLDFYKDHKDSVENGLAKLLAANATGSFFGPDGDFYFGGYPLQFAVCSNSIEIFDLVLSYASTIVTLESGIESDGSESGRKESLNMGPNVIFMRDSFGNTVIHLCAIHGLRKMFQHVCTTAETIIFRELKLLYSNNIEKDPGRSRSYILSKAVDIVSEGFVGYKLLSSGVTLPTPDKYDTWLIEETKNKLDERLMYALNKFLHSPLTLAASLKRAPGDTRESIFKDLLFYYKRPLWSYGPISSTELSLEGIDTGYNLKRFEPAGGDSRVCRSAISWLCESESEQNIQIPEISSIIETKWKRFGLPLFILDGILDGLITLLLTLILIFIDFAPTIHPKAPTDWFVDILYALALVLFLAIFLIECGVILNDPRSYLGIRGTAFFHCLCRALKSITFFFFIGFQIADGTATMQNRSDDIYNSALESPQDSRAVKISLTVCVMTAWIHGYYYLIGFESTGPFLIVLSRIVISDLPYFFQFFLFVLLAFACSISMVTNDVVSDTFGFSRLLEAIVGLIQKTVNISPSSTYPAGLITADDVTIDLQWLQDLQITMFYGVVVLVLINLLIAIMNSTFGIYSSVNEAFFLLEKCHIMDYLEIHMSKGELEENRKSYSNKKHMTVSSADGLTEIKSESYTISQQDFVDNWMSKAPTKADIEKLKKTTIFIIDPQIDFHPGGALAVAGANEDSKRIADMIRNNKEFIHEIFVSMDSHHPSHIAHAMFWVDRNGHKPNPFTTITYQDVLTGTWRPRDTDPEVKEWCLYYTKSLERKGRMTLTIWPEHCIIGSRGHAVEENLNAAIQEWANYAQRPVNYVMKGQNCRTEMYSALIAEVVDPRDQYTDLNNELLSMLRVSDRVLQYYYIIL